MSRLAVDKIIGANTESIVDLSSINNIKMPAGHVIQVQSAQLTAENQFTVTSTTQADIMSVTITPKFASSKILFQMAGDCGSSGTNKASRKIRTKFSSRICYKPLKELLIKLLNI